MPKFKTEFKGCPAGKVYPVTYQPGDEVPPELLAAAVAAGAIAAPAKPKARGKTEAPADDKPPADGEGGDDETNEGGDGTDADQPDLLTGGADALA